MYTRALLARRISELHLEKFIQNGFGELLRSKEGRGLAKPRNNRFPIASLQAKGMSDATMFVVAVKQTSQ